MRKTGGVLTIIGGIIGIIIGISQISGVEDIVIDIGGVEAPLFAYGIVALIVGIVALVGGIYALTARVWSFALAGGIVLVVSGVGHIGPWMRFLDPGMNSFAPIVIGLTGVVFITLGILGTIFIALRRREFE